VQHHAVRREDHLVLNPSQGNLASDVDNLFSLCQPVLLHLLCRLEHIVARGDVVSLEHAV